MKQFIRTAAISLLVSSSTIYASGPLVGGGGGGTTNQMVVLNAKNISDIRLESEDIVHFEEILKDTKAFNVKELSNNLYKIDFSASQIKDIQLIDGSIISGDMGGGGTSL